MLGIIHVVNEGELSASKHTKLVLYLQTSATIDLFS